MSMSDSCKTCYYWNPEPWDMAPEQGDAWCVEKNRRTMAGDLCRSFHDKAVRIDPRTGREMEKGKCESL